MFFRLLIFEAGDLALKPREVFLPLRVARRGRDQRRNYFVAFVQLNQSLFRIPKLHVQRDDGDVGTRQLLAPLGIARIPRIEVSRMWRPSR